MRAAVNIDRQPLTRQSVRQLLSKGEFLLQDCCVNFTSERAVRVRESASRKYIFWMSRSVENRLAQSSYYV